MTARAPISPAARIIVTAAGRIECVVAGTGPAILALHGGMGGCDQSWLLARAVLENVDRYRVIGVSRPGYLGTKRDVGTTPAEQADAYAALLDALGIDTATLLAVSAGGPSALAFAARHPDRCRALVLVSACTGRLATPPEVLRRMRPMRVLARVPGLAGFLGRATQRNPEAAAARSIRDPELRIRTLHHPQAGPLLRALQSSIYDHMAKRLPGTLNDIAQFARLEQLPPAPLSTPALIVHGDRDNVVPFDHAQAARKMMPRAELLTIPDGEHVCLFTHLDAVRHKARTLLC